MSLIGVALCSMAIGALLVRRGAELLDWDVWVAALMAGGIAYFATLGG